MFVVRTQKYNWLLCFLQICWTHLLVLKLFLDFVKGFLYRPSSHFFIKIALLLHFQPVCLLFLFLALVYCQGPQVKCWRKERRVDNYALLLMLRKKYYFSLLNLMLTKSFLKMYVLYQAEGFLLFGWNDHKEWAILD